MSSRQLTTTSYAILGLLAIQPWAAYDLAKQMRRSLRFVWPRAESNLYAEPKRLVEAGLAEAHEEWNGDRKRTMYSITKRGRLALREWLATPSPGQRHESEPVLRLLYANYGSKDDLLAVIARIAEDAETLRAHWAERADEWRGKGLFPERIHVNALVATLGIAQADAAARWAAWATAEVAQWNDTQTPDVNWATRTMRAPTDDRPTSDKP